MVDDIHKSVFLKKLQIAQGDAYTLVGEYLGGKVKTTFVHEKCGYTWATAPANILRAKSCPSCRGNIKLTTADFIAEVKAIAGDEYVVMGEYVNAKVPIRILHTVCGTENMQAPTDFKAGKRCAYCSGVGMDTTQFHKRILNLVGTEYTVVGEYVSARTHIELRHETCGTMYSVTPSDFYRGSRCWECWKKSQTKTPEWFKNEVRQACGDEYKVLSDYTKAREPVKMRHEQCKYEWEVTPTNFLNRESRCPNCKYSKGEVLVEAILDREEIAYIREHKFEGCKHKRLLPFDFYIPALNLCMEYDGKQHYSPVNFGGIDADRAEANYKVTVKRDRIKNKFCTTNGIKLVRLPYYFTEAELESAVLKACSQ